MSDAESSEEYYRDLVSTLRGRRLSEAQISEAVREVRSECEASGVGPRERFGAPGNYAKTFAEGRSRSLGNWVLTIAILLGAAVLGVHTWNSLVLRIENEPWQTLVLVASVVLVVAVAAVVAGQLDRRLPRDGGH